MLNYFRVERLLFLSVVSMFSLAGCASKLVLKDGINATFNVYNQKDDKREKLGANPIYVLIEKQDDGQLNVIKLSKRNINISNNDQERLVISNNFTNIAPDYEDFEMRYEEYPASGNRHNYKFVCYGDYKAKHKGDNYSPCRSDFAYYAGKGPTLNSVIGIGSGYNYFYGLNTASIAKIATENDVIEKAKALASSNDLTIELMKSKSSVNPLSVKEVWFVERSKKGPVERYLFKPTKFLHSGDVVTEDKKLGVLTSGLALANAIISGLGHTNKVIPYDNMTIFKIYEHKHPCSNVYAKYSNGENTDAVICPDTIDDRYIFKAYKGDKNWTIDSIQGLRKEINSGDDWKEVTIKFTDDMIDQIRFLAAGDAKKLEGGKSN